MTQNLLSILEQGADQLRLEHVKRDLRIQMAKRVISIVHWVQNPMMENPDVASRHCPMFAKIIIKVFTTLRVFDQATVFLHASCDTPTMVQAPTT